MLCLPAPPEYNSCSAELYLCLNGTHCEYNLFRIWSILGSSMPRSKYILDPSVQSSAAFGQSYVPPPQPQSFGAQPQTFGTQPQSFGGQQQTFGAQPQTFGTQPNAYGNPLPPPNNHQQPFNQFNNQPFNPAPIPSNPIPIATPSGPSSIMNPIQQIGAFVPPIEVAQAAMPQQQMQRNPTPPPGWNDPPVLKSRAVSCITHFAYILIENIGIY